MWPGTARRVQKVAPDRSSTGGGVPKTLPIQRVQGLKVMDAGGAGASGATGASAGPVFG